MRTPAQIAAALAASPFDPEAEHTLQILFLAAPPDEATGAAVAALGNDFDALRVNGREVYWLCRGKITESQVKTNAFEKALKRSPTTARNITMLRRLLETYG